MTSPSRRAGRAFLPLQGPSPGHCYSSWRVTPLASDRAQRMNDPSEPIPQEEFAAPQLCIFAYPGLPRPPARIHEPGCGEMGDIGRPRLRKSQKDAPLWPRLPPPLPLPGCPSATLCALTGQHNVSDGHYVPGKDKLPLFFPWFTLSMV